MAIVTGFHKPPPPILGCVLTFPARHVLMMTITREGQLNSITSLLHWQMSDVLDWFEGEPSLRVVIVTGSGSKAFCAGSDLIEMKDKTDDHDYQQLWKRHHPPTGFAGIGRRRGKKPILAAVNGLALGGGFEIILNCDIVVASPAATFGLPETLRGLYAYGGGLPRLVWTCGMHVASELALLGRTFDVQEAKSYGLVNMVSKSLETLVDEAVAVASQIASISPDAIVVTREALREVWETPNVERAFELHEQRFRNKLYSGENAREGLAAFAEKRAPRWVPSKL